MNAIATHAIDMAISIFCLWWLHHSRFSSL